MLYRVNFLYDGRYTSLFKRADSEDAAYDMAYDVLDSAKEIVHLGTNKVELSHIKYLDYIDWYEEETDEKMFCYKCYVDNNERMGKKAEIEENLNEDTRTYYLEFEVSFDRSRTLKEFHLLMQELNGIDWTDPELIGSEVYSRSTKDRITGHSLLTDEEFNYILNLAYGKLDEEYDKFFNGDEEAV